MWVADSAAVCLLKPRAGRGKSLGSAPDPIGQFYWTTAVFHTKPTLTETDQQRLVTNKLTKHKLDGWRDRQTGRQTGRLKDGSTDRYWRQTADRQLHTVDKTDRQKERQVDEENIGSYDIDRQTE